LTIGSTGFERATGGCLWGEGERELWELELGLGVRGIEDIRGNKKLCSYSRKIDPTAFGIDATKRSELGTK